MNDRQLGLFREFLAFASSALLAYGLGTAAIWQEVTGASVAIFTLVWAIRANEGWEKLASLFRKILSSVGGVLVLTGVMSPEKSEAIMGLIFTLLSMTWTLWAKPSNIPAIVLLACATLFLPSCAAGGGFDASQLPPIKVVTPWGSGSKDADGSLALDTPWGSGSKDAGGVVVLLPVLPEK